MKKKLVFGLVMILALACVLVSCNSEVSAENGVGSAKTGSIVIGQEASKAVGYTVSYTDTVEELYWYYTAAKKDNGYRTGVTEVLAPVSTSQGLQGKTLTNFSYGLWDLNFYGFKQPSDNLDKADAVYTGSVLNFLVSQEVNNADVELVLGNASTEIDFGTEGIYFTFDHNVSASTFTLAVTDNKGTVTVPTSGVISNEGKTVTFTGLTYAGTTSNISGEHTMVFTLSQVLSGGSNIEIEAANYTLEFTVTTGTKTTISGDLTQNNQTGDIYINSASLSAAAAVSVSKALSSKVVPVTNISVDGSGAGTASVSKQTTITNGDLKVTYPVGAKIAVDGNTTHIDPDTVVDRKSDAQTGFEYVSDTASSTSITIADTEAVSQYKLTINLDSNNTVLVPVEKYIGTGLAITDIYHNSSTPMSKTNVDGGTEYWQYNSTTGYLTLYVFHASPFDIVYQKVVATILTANYYSLSEALSAAIDGDVVTLLCDVSLSKTYHPGFKYTFATDGEWIDIWQCWGMEGMKDENGNDCPNYVSINDNTQYRDLSVDEGQNEAWVSGKYLYENHSTDFPVNISRYSREWVNEVEDESTCTAVVPRNVTIDLNGKTITRGSGSGNGLQIRNDLTVTVKNGTLKSTSMDIVDVGSGSNTRFENCKVVSETGSFEESLIKARGEGAEGDSNPTSVTFVNCSFEDSGFNISGLSDTPHKVNVSVKDSTFTSNYSTSSSFVYFNYYTYGDFRLENTTMTKAGGNCISFGMSSSSNGGKTLNTVFKDVSLSVSNSAAPYSVSNSNTFNLSEEGNNTYISNGESWSLN